MDLPNKKDVLPESSPVDSEVPKTPEVDTPGKEVVPEVPTAPQPENPSVPSIPEEPADPKKPPKGFVPYEALAEERRLRQEEARKRQEAEQKLGQITPTSVLSDTIPDDSDLSEEGKALNQQIRILTGKLNALESEKEMEKIVTVYPAIKGAEPEFQEFCSQYPGVAKDRLVKLFLAEKGVSLAPGRKGLEQPTAGTGTPPTAKWKKEDVDRLMKSQPKVFERLLREGKIRAEDIE